MALLLAAGVALALAIAPQQATADLAALSDWSKGVVTNYGGPADGMSPDQPSFGTQDGSCGYGVLSKTTWPYWSVGALSTSSPFYNAGPIDGCGQCYQIQCLNSGGQYAGRCNTDNPVSVIIQITDSCPECLVNQMDIQALTFAKLAPLGNGRIDVQFRRVECVPPGQMVVFVDNNAGSGGWLRLFIEQAGGQASVSAVQVRTSGSSSAWQSMSNVWGSDWEMTASPAYPLDISISGPDGQTVQAFNVITASGQIGNFPTQAQFHITNPTDNLLSYPTNVQTESSTPAASPSPTGQSPAPTGGACTCSDVPTPVFSCTQQVGWGQCQQPWMLAGDSTAPSGFCAQSCGRCKC